MEAETPRFRNRLIGGVYVPEAPAAEMDDQQKPRGARATGGDA
jgi:hypothetical protein